MVAASPLTAASLRLSRPEHEALLLFREAAEGGDPYMAHVSLATVNRLLQRGLIRRHTLEEATYLLRHHVPTLAGLAWLDVMTHGPSGMHDLPNRDTSVSIISATHEAVSGSAGANSIGREH